MNMPIKFDTLEYARKLAESGMPTAQASAQAQALSDALAEATVTPGELVLLRTDLTARIEIVKHDVDTLKHDVDSLRNDLEKFKISVNAKFTTLFWMMGISMALHAVTIATLLEVLARLP
jgi:hypothetical protein